MNERDFMHQAALAWNNRCSELGLKPGTQKRQHQLEAFLQGAIAVAAALGVMPIHRAQQIHFLVMVDRAEQYLAEMLKEEAQP